LVNQLDYVRLITKCNLFICRRVGSLWYLISCQSRKIKLRILYIFYLKILEIHYMSS